MLTLPFAKPRGEHSEGPKELTVLEPCGKTKGSRHPPPFNHQPLLAKVPLTAPSSKLPSPNPAT